MKVGVQLPEVEWEVPFPEYLAMARAAEEAGFDSIWVGDHLIYDLPDGARGPWEAWTTLAAIAAALKVAPATKSLQSLELQGNSFTVGGGMLKKTPPAVKAIEEACKRGKVRVHLKKQGGGTL